MVAPKRHRRTALAICGGKGIMASGSFMIYTFVPVAMAAVRTWSLDMVGLWWGVE